MCSRRWNFIEGFRLVILLLVCGALCPFLDIGGGRWRMPCSCAFALCKAVRSGYDTERCMYIAMSKSSCSRE